MRGVRRYERKEQHQDGHSRPDAAPWHHAGTLHEVDLETSDNGYLVYDVEIAGHEGNNHEVKVDASNGEILHQDLEDEADDSD